MTTTTLKMIDKKIAVFTTNRDKLKSLGHEIAMLIFDHAMAHGDCTRAIKLAVQMPNSWQPQLVAWFKAFSPIRVVVNNNKCELSPEYKKAADANKADFWDREAASSTPFYDLTQEPKAEKVYTFAELVKLVERLAPAIEKKIKNGDVPEWDIPSARAMVTKLESLHFEKVTPEEAVAELPVPVVAAAA